MKNNKSKKNTWLWILFILVVIIIIAAIFIFKNGSSNSISSEELQNLIKNGSIKSENTSYYYDSKSGYDIISGYYRNADGSISKFTCYMPDSLFKIVFGGANQEMIKWISGVVATIPGTSIMSYVSAFLPLLILIVFYIWMFGAMSKGGMSGGSMFGVGKSKTVPKKSNTKFSDVAGIAEEKEELNELVDYLKQPQKYAQYGARVPKGVLMEGPPGTGKTLLAKAVSGEAGVPFFATSGSEFEEMFVGLGASRIRDLFSSAKKAAPAIIFIDEIDVVGRKRTGGIGGSGTAEQTLNQLLVEMDGFEGNTGIIVIAATNRVDVLDEALIRPGRFDRTIQVTLPNAKQREEILKLHARNKTISPEVNWKFVSDRTPGFSGAQLENVLNEAAILMVRQGKTVISIEDIDEAIDRVVGGPAKKSTIMTPKDKQIVSYHEAGHALIGLKLDSASRVQKVSIIPRGNAGGYTIMTPKDETLFSSKTDLFAMITGYLGGRAAEEIMFGVTEITTGAHDDLDKATNIARRMVTQFGMSELGLTKLLTMREENAGHIRGVYSESVAEQIDKQIDKILEDCYVNAKKLINQHKGELELIAESLRILETINVEQITYIDKNMKLPEEVLKEKEARTKREEKIKEGKIIEIDPNEEN
ncbi:ATP-dependent zinc metalloprotease FtsH [Spiroplasma endosymbiont of Crioceris asparagi]|uniref:ATP-dependent zinc metalloprotease FtsH n=1 Tax=Spiroplasma endosymbiont of Crioceris asparagi TaxID=3066286 RepID=UPI0030CEBC4D